MGRLRFRPRDRGRGSRALNLGDDAGRLRGGRLCGLSQSERAARCVVGELKSHANPRVLNCERKQSRPIPTEIIFAREGNRAAREQSDARPRRVRQIIEAVRIFAQHQKRIAGFAERKVPNNVFDTT